MKTHLPLLLLLLSFDLFASSVYMPQGYFTKEEQVLDYVVDNYIAPNSIEAPGNREEFKMMLKEWNPQIDDWTAIKPKSAIHVQQKSPIWDLSFGFNVFINTEKLNNGQEVELTTMSELVSLQASFFHRIKLSSFVRLTYEYKNDYTVAETEETISFPATYNMEYGLFYSNPKSSWAFHASLEKERTSFISFNDKDNVYYDEILANLQIANMDIYWANVGFRYRIPTEYRGFYLVADFGQSIYGTKKLKDGSIDETVTAQKAKGGLKYYFLGKLWIQGFAQYLYMKTRTEATSLQYGVQTGYTF